MTKDEWKELERKMAARQAEICPLCECSTWGIAFCANEGCPSGYKPYDQPEKR